jgi:hypothetical protein
MSGSDFSFLKNKPSGTCITEKHFHRSLPLQPGGTVRASVQNRLVMSLFLRFAGVLCFLFIGIASPAQPDSIRRTPWLQRKPGAELKLSAMLQFWTTYTMGQEIFDADLKTYLPVEDRLNAYFRRARVLLRGEPYEGLNYYLALHFDQAGHDLLSATQGPNNAAEPAVGVWDAFVQWRLPFAGDALHLTGGWFRPQFQRESITPAWSVASMEKSTSQNYVRQHLTGRGPGRAAGLNIGGMVKGERVSLLYNAGLFNPLLTGLGGNSVGIKYAPLLTGRVSLSLGDPEMERYAIAYTTQYFGERKGISFDFNLARQGQTDQFESAVAFGPGFLFNYGPWNLDGEWIWMQRNGHSAGDRFFSARAASGHVRFGYNIPAGRFLLQPAGMLMLFDGAMDAAGQADARALKLSAGTEHSIDFGLNWYLNRRDLAIQLHYTMHRGDAGAAEDGSTVNAFFNQATIGAIRRGNWIGLGFNAVF